MLVDNGDVIAFDLLAKGEPPVVYWEHETDEVTFPMNISNPIPYIGEFCVQ